MSISVALCTHNGAQFLEDQLASIAAQDRLPDELVICDDCSSDATAGLVAQFAARAPFPVRFEVNPKQLGSTKNFERAIELCRGETIVLADQDDVWMQNKVAALDRALSSSSDLGFAFSDALMVGEDLRPLGYTLWDAIRFSQRERRRISAGHNLEVLLKHYVVTGATLAFRAKFKPLILPIPTTWIHDAWIALLIGAVCRCSSISEPLIQYRQHPRQQFGEKKRSLYEQYQIAKTMTQKSYRSVADAYALAYERLQAVPDFEASAEALTALEGKIAHFKTRTRMRDKGAVRLPLILLEILKRGYGHYSLGWKSIAQDLFL